MQTTMRSFSCCRCFRRKANTDPDIGTFGFGVETSGVASPTSTQSSSQSVSPRHTNHHHSDPDTLESAEIESFAVGESTPLPNHPPNNQLRGHPVRPSLSISHLRLSGTSDTSYSHRSVSPLQADDLFVARDIWSAAYASLRGDPTLEPLIEKYESFFHAVLWPEKGLPRTDSGLTGEEMPSCCPKLCFLTMLYLM